MDDNTKDALKRRAEEIRYERDSRDNTAERVGSLLYDIVDNLDPEIPTYVSYDIIPTPSVLQFSVNSETNKYIPDSLQVSCVVEKREGDTITIIDPDESGKIIVDERYTLYYKTISNNSDSEYTEYTGPIEVASGEGSSSYITSVNFYLAETITITNIVGLVKQVNVPVMRNGKAGQPGEKGEDAIRIVQDNPMDGIPCDSSGITTIPVSINTSVKLYKGTEILPDTTIESGDVGSIADIAGTITSDSGVFNITWDIPVNTILENASYQIPIKITYNRVKYTTTFIVNAVRAGANGKTPVIKNLSPTPNQIVFKNGEETVIKYVDLQIKSVEGTNVSYTDVENSNLWVRYSFDCMPGSSTEGVAWPTRTESPQGVPVISTSGKNLYIATFSMSDSSLVDNQTIAILCDGEKGDQGQQGEAGDDAVTYEIQSSIESVKILSDQTSVSKSITFRFYSKVGNTEKQAFDTYFTIYTRNNVGFYSLVYPPISSLYNSVSVTHAFNNITQSVNAIVIYIWGNDSSAVPTENPQNYPPENYPYLAKKEIPILKDGNTGEKGEKGDAGSVGRYYYYAGDWSTVASARSLAVDDKKSPYVLYDTKYYMCLALTDNEHIYDNNPSINPTFWAEMPELNYVISKAIFSDYARLGSSIISGDWMMSQHGIMYDPQGGEHSITSSSTTEGAEGTYTYGGITYNTENSYIKFDPQFPNSSKSGELNFAPNYALDMLTGTTYQQKAVVRGTIYATNGEFTGSINVKALRTSMVTLQGGTDASNATIIPLDTNPAGSYFLKGGGHFRLPVAWDYIGLQITLFTTIGPNWEPVYIYADQRLSTGYGFNINGYKESDKNEITLNFSEILSDGSSSAITLLSTTIFSDNDASWLVTSHTQSLSCGSHRFYPGGRLINE